MKRVVWALPVVLAAAGVAMAWNPITVRATGALRWDDTSAVVWNPDGGDLGMWNNATAITEMASGFAVWAGVGQSVLSYSQGGQIVDGGGTPVDVDASNYSAIINLPNGQNPIIFDNDREIFDMLGTPSSVLGFAGFRSTDGMGTITKGFAVMQGDWIDGDAGDGREAALTVFRGAIVHEFGHFNGLGHTTVNRHLTSGIGSCSLPTDANFVTMHPVAHDDSLDLHLDDRNGVSSLYPTVSFINNRAQINGTLFSTDSATPFDGANMILRLDTTSCNSLYNNALAMQSGVNPGEDGGSGSYTFRGLTVPKDHTLEVVPVTGGGSFPIGGSSPPALPGPSEFYNGANESTFDPPDDPTAVSTITVTTGGATTPNIDILLNSTAGPGTLGGGMDALIVNVFDGETPGPPLKLTLDDGTPDSLTGFLSTTRAGWLNRFVPTAGQYPFRIDSVEVFWSNADPSITVGRNVQVVLKAGSTDDSPNSATTVTLTNANTTITALNTFVTYAVTAANPDDLVIDSGDFFLGFFDLDGDDVEDSAIATLDTATAASNQSWLGPSGTSNPPSSYSEIGGATFMIRAGGATSPAAGAIHLSWGDPCNALDVPGQDYAVYEGNISSLAGVQDHAPILCGTAMEQSVILDPVVGDKFWVVAPLLADREGSQGSGTSVLRTPVSTCEVVQPSACP